MENKKQVIDYLQLHNIPFQITDHPPLFTVEQAKEREDIIPWTHTKNIFIRDKKKNYYMITLEAHKKLDTKIFKLQAGISDFSFASPEQLFEQLQITPWSVWIFWLLHNPKIQLFIDQDIRKSESAGRHPNDNTATIVLWKKSLESYLKRIKVEYKIIIL